VRLRELKNIIIKYLHSDGLRNNQLTATLSNIYNCEQWLAEHAEVEDMLFIPAIRRLEQRSKQNDVSVKISNMINQNPNAQDQLSDRERDVIIAVVQGMSNIGDCRPPVHLGQHGHHPTVVTSPASCRFIRQPAHHLCHRQ
jgi:regulator of cell morphogenesis and NO signaling